jgi:hypothetical protein
VALGIDAALRARVNAEASARLTALHDELRLALTTMTAREHLIVSDLRRRHARLAASLVQPGLFDRRASRASAAQTALLDAALVRSGTRLRDLAAASTLRIDATSLLFAVAFQ